MVPFKRPISFAEVQDRNLDSDKTVALFGLQNLKAFSRPLARLTRVLDDLER
jgi:hypothetical protein